MSTIKTIPRETGGATPRFPTYVDIVYLDDGLAASYTCPAYASWALITCDGGVWCNATTTATVPAADVTNGSGSFYIANGMQIGIESGVTYSFIRAGSTTVRISIGVYQ